MMACKEISKAEAAALFADIEARQAARAAKLPTEQHALEAMFEAYDRLRELGWRESMYAPKDKPLELIEPGSTGIHKGQRGLHDEDDKFWIFDGDVWPARPILWRLETKAE